MSKWFLNLVVATYICCLFVRKLKNRSGNTSVEIIDKSKGKFNVVKTIEGSKSDEGIVLLLHQAKHELSLLNSQMS